MKPADTYPPAFIPLTDEARSQAYLLIDELLFLWPADSNKGRAVRNLAVLSGHPNFPLSRSLNSHPTNPALRAGSIAHWERIRAEGRTVEGPASLSEGGLG